jgi:hypothetical protein
MQKLLITTFSGVLLFGSGFIDDSFAQTVDKPVPAPTSDEARQTATADNQIANEVEARIADFKASLKLNPDQEKNWPDLEAALRDEGIEKSKTQMAGRSARHDRDERPNDISLMRAEADRLAQKSTSLKKLANAAEPFYAGLEDSQKRKLAQFIRMQFKSDNR